MLLTVQTYQQKREIWGFADEYWGFRSLFALHYTGNRLVYSSFSHRSTKGDQGNVLKRSAPFVKEKVQELLHHTVLRSDYV